MEPALNTKPLYDSNDYIVNELGEIWSVDRVVKQEYGEKVRMRNLKGKKLNVFQGRVQVFVKDKLGKSRKRIYSVSQVMKDHFPK